MKIYCLAQLLAILADNHMNLNIERKIMQKLICLVMIIHTQINLYESNKDY